MRRYRVGRFRRIIHTSRAFFALEGISKPFLIFQFINHSEMLDLALSRMPKFGGKINILHHCAIYSI